MTVFAWRPTSELPLKKDFKGEDMPYYVLSAGMRVRTEKGHEFLVGDTSELGGSCDCCRYFHTDSQGDRANIAEWCWQVPTTPEQMGEYLTSLGWVCMSPATCKDIADTMEKFK